MLGSEPIAMRRASHSHRKRYTREHANLVALRCDINAACISRLKSFLSFSPSTGAPPGFQCFHATIYCTYLHRQTLQQRHPAPILRR